MKPPRHVRSGWGPGRSPGGVRGGAPRRFSTRTYCPSQRRNYHNSYSYHDPVQSYHYLDARTRTSHLLPRTLTCHRGRWEPLPRPNRVQARSAGGPTPSAARSMGCTLRRTAAGSSAPACTCAASCALPAAPASAAPGSREPPEPPTTPTTAAAPAAPAPSPPAPSTSPSPPPPAGVGSAALRPSFDKPETRAHARRSDKR